jgi:hypothetical protein
MIQYGKRFTTEGTELHKEKRKINLTARIAKEKQRPQEDAYFFAPLRLYGGPCGSVLFFAPFALLLCVFA